MKQFGLPGLSVQDKLMPSLCDITCCVTHSAFDFCDPRLCISQLPLLSLVEAPFQCSITALETPARWLAKPLHAYSLAPNQPAAEV